MRPRNAWSYTGDADSVLVCTGDRGTVNYVELANVLATVVEDRFAGTVLSGIVVKVDGSFESMCLVKKKCFFYMEDGKVYTKDLGSVRKDYSPITLKLIGVCMYVINTATSRDGIQEALTLAIGKVFAAIMKGTVSNANMMAEGKVNGAPCYIYISRSGVMKRFHLDSASRVDDIDLEWVRRRTLSSMAYTMIAVGMPYPVSMTMTYAMARRIDRTE